MKINLVFCLSNRMQNISHPSMRKKNNIDLLKQIMLQNGYPVKMLNHFLYNTHTPRPINYPHNNPNDTTTNRVANNDMYSRVVIKPGGSRKQICGHPVYFKKTKSYFNKFYISLS